MVFFSLALISVSRAAPALTLAGSPVIKQIIAEAALVLSKQERLEIHFKTNGNSNDGIAALGSGEVQIAMITRPINTEDRSSWPESNFKPIYLGIQAVAVGVAQDVWESGIHQITRDQLRAIYEGKLTNWKQIGGSDEPIVFFNIAERRGVWEMFIQWIYGDSALAPLAQFPIMKNDEDTRNSIEFKRGSISLLSPKMIDGRSCSALALDSGEGQAHLPEIASFVDGSYPLMKPMYLVVNERPWGSVKTLVDYMFTPAGRRLIVKHGCFSADELGIHDQ